jgi:hypothetical protein
MAASTTSVNPFARVLQFYENFIRAKLVPGDLEKIARKYSANPAKLVGDLQQKYPFPIPDCVSTRHIARLCQLYEVPSSYKALCDIGSVPYEPRSDVYSADFDPLHSLKWNTISVSHLNAPVLDNTTKLHVLLPGKNETVTAVPSASQPISKSASQTSLASSFAPVEKAKHSFETIAESSLHVRRRGQAKEEATASPLVLLHTYMQTRVRVRIVIRRNHG